MFLRIPSSVPIHFTIDDINMQAFHGLLTMKRVPHQDFLTEMANSVTSAASGLVLSRVERGSTSFERKHKSLWNRWVQGPLAASASLRTDDSDVMVLKRNQTFLYSPFEDADSAPYRIVNLFRKKSNKWLLDTIGYTNEDTIVHAQLLIHDELSDTYQLDSGLDRRYASHSYIVCRGHELGDSIGSLESRFEDSI
jgi:hypothetical protein